MSVISRRTGQSALLVGGAKDRAGHAIAAAAALAPEKLGTVFTRYEPVEIMADAQRLDQDAERSMGPLAGLIISIKDLFDLAGEVTTAGSIALANQVPAAQDADVVRRLKQAGAIMGGRTTMSEFAYSGVGLNPHFGNPSNALDADRISGGSSSGAALSVALGISDIGLGTDTGGSVRIPAALNGLCGFKPSQASVPLQGAFPLSAHYDSIGPIARTIEDCAKVYGVLSQSNPEVIDLSQKPRIGVLRSPFTDGLDHQTSRDFGAALTVLSSGGFELVDTTLSMLAGYGDVNSLIVGSDVLDVHRARLDILQTKGDPRVLRRILLAQNFSAEMVAKAHRQRSKAIAAFGELAQGFDGFIAPTVPCVAPLIAEVEADYDRLNALMLRNPSVVNFLDGCAATIPMHGSQALATGLMLFAPARRDWQILEIAARAQSLLGS